MYATAGSIAHDAVNGLLPAEQLIGKRRGKKEVPEPHLGATHTLLKNM
jgi:hypothetical protein